MLAMVKEIVSEGSCWRLSGSKHLLTSATRAKSCTTLSLCFDLPALRVQADQMLVLQKLDQPQAALRQICSLSTAVIPAKLHACSRLQGSNASMCPASAG